MTLTIRLSRPRDVEQLIAIWRRAVDATHPFLTADDRLAIEAEVRSSFPKARFQVACDGDDRPLGFMLTDGPHLEALFVDPDHHGQGIGRALLQDATGDRQILTADVNEANVEALGFYDRMGFRIVGRSDLDGQGRPYPLLHLRRPGLSNAAPDRTL